MRQPSSPSPRNWAVLSSGNRPLDAQVVYHAGADWPTGAYDFVSLRDGLKPLGSFCLKGLGGGASAANVFMSNVPHGNVREARQCQAQELGFDRANRCTRVSAWITKAILRYSAVMRQSELGRMQPVPRPGLPRLVGRTGSLGGPAPQSSSPLCAAETKEAQVRAAETKEAPVPIATRPKRSAHGVAAAWATLVPAKRRRRSGASQGPATCTRVDSTGIGPVIGGVDGARRTRQANQSQARPRRACA